MELSRVQLELEKKVQDLWVGGRGHTSNFGSQGDEENLARKTMRF